MRQYLIVAILMGVFSFVAFRSTYIRYGSSVVRAILVAAAFLLAVPAALFASNYLLLVPFDDWFVDFHSIPGIEATSGLVGALLGVVFASSRLRTHWLNTPVLAVATAGVVMLVVAPFADQLLYSHPWKHYGNRWKDGVCQQTTPWTCVPASCATVVRMLGGNVTERELAVDAGTNSTGTEIWYLKRAMRRRGYDIEPNESHRSLRDAPVPCVLSVMFGDVGHAVVLLDKDKTGPEIGDPSGLRRRYTWSAFERKYRPKPVFIVVRKLGSHH